MLLGVKIYCLKIPTNKIKTRNSLKEEVCNMYSWQEFMFIMYKALLNFLRKATYGLTLNILSLSLTRQERQCNREETVFSTNGAGTTGHPQSKK